MFKCKTTNNNSRGEAKTGEKWVEKRKRELELMCCLKKS